MATVSSSPESPPSESPPEDDHDAAAVSPSTSGADNDQDDDDKTTKPRTSIAIPPITPVASQQDPEALARGLEGRFVDEFGNVLGWDGTVLGRVRGDLPSMVGRPVAAQGHIVDADGQVAGFVSENFVAPAASSPPSRPQPPPSRKPLDRGLRVDGDGTIYDHEGVPVGRMTQAQGTPRPGESRRGHAPGTCSPSPSPAAPSPSEVCLDVKSTHDGIQLIIKIPTVFHACPGPPPSPPS